MRTLLALVPLLAACGSSVSITDLRCRPVGCQPKDNPFRLQLEAVYTDPSLTLPTSALVLRVDQTALPEIPLAPKVPAGRTLGTIAFDVDVPLREPVDGSKLTVGVRTKDAAGVVSDEITLDFTMKL